MCCYILEHQRGITYYERIIRIVSLLGILLAGFYRAKLLLSHTRNHSQQKQTHSSTFEPYM